MKAENNQGRALLSQWSGASSVIRKAGMVKRAANYRATSCTRRDPTRNCYPFHDKDGYEEPTSHAQLTRMFH